MAELEIDQSNLPRVQEVRQCFAVLEDGALAHNLQEQEIEQYYTANVQKSQLVQNDIRIARRLQDEERDQLQHVSRQREEQDSEYARLIQEELCRGAEEAHRREQEDQQIAKRIQEEEECYARRRPESHVSANRGVPATGRAPPLDMGELQQVLLDEELARRLQEEEGVTTRSPRASSPPRRTCVDGDFRVAQVAQDEEIARFIQKQEMRSGHGWEEADASGGSSPDAGEACMGAPRDWRAARHRQQRERLDSQGLPSPPEDYPPDDPPSSPVAMALQHPPLRNIAEDLDPTFQAKRSANVRTGNTDAVSQDHPPHQTQQGGYGGREETNFVPPTKRPNEKLGATKAKEKRENSKQKENCKQQ